MRSQRNNCKLAVSSSVLMKQISISKRALSRPAPMKWSSSSAISQNSSPSQRASSTQSKKALSYSRCLSAPCGGLFFAKDAHGFVLACGKDEDFEVCIGVIVFPELGTAGRDDVS